jgi:hypothetical protein
MRLMLLGLALVPALCGTAGAQAHRPGAGAPARVPANPQPIGFMLNAHTVAAFGTSAGDAGRAAGCRSVTRSTAR